MKDEAKDFQSQQRVFRIILMRTIIINVYPFVTNFQYFYPCCNMTLHRYITNNNITNVISFSHSDYL